VQFTDEEFSSAIRTLADSENTKFKIFNVFQDKIAAKSAASCQARALDISHE